MADKIDDGGPAFPQTNKQRYADPVHGAVRPSDIYGEAHAGMSLRDYFAIHAPEPTEERILSEMRYDKDANPHNDTYKPRIRTRLEIIVDNRYYFADMMIARRKVHVER